MDEPTVNADSMNSLALSHWRRPKKCIRITILSHHNKARKYLSSMGFDIYELFHHRRVNYCRRDPTSNPPIDDRIIVPVYDALDYHDTRRKPQWKPAGWQALSPGEVGSFDPLDSIMPQGMVESGTLYGLDKAFPEHGPIILAGCVTDVWRLGDSSISTFGDEMTPAQEERIINLLRGRPIVVASKSGTSESSNELVRRLAERRSLIHDWSPVLCVKLPILNDVSSDGNRKELWRLINQALKNYEALPISRRGGQNAPQSNERSLT